MHLARVLPISRFALVLADLPEDAAILLFPRLNPGRRLSAATSDSPAVPSASLQRIESGGWLSDFTL